MYLELIVLSSLFMLSISGKGDSMVGILMKTCLVLVRAVIFQLFQFMRAGCVYSPFIYSLVLASSVHHKEEVNMTLTSYGERRSLSFYVYSHTVSVNAEMQIRLESLKKR